VQVAWSPTPTAPPTSPSASTTPVAAAR
jgi:hypothetical protein